MQAIFSSIGYIGSGTMCSAIARIIAKVEPEIPMIMSNRTHQKAVDLANEFLNAMAVSNAEAAEAELIFLGVKPQFMEEALNSCKDVLKARSEKGERFVLVTMAAGLTMQTICEMAGGDYPVIRMMPNTPIAVGEGVIQYCSKDVTEEEIGEFERLLKESGTVDALPENLMDAAACVSGCGPAFIYMVIEALADGGVACGLPRQKALMYAAQMVEGAGKLAKTSGKHPGKLKDEVTSPGGTTIQGVRTLEENAVRGAFTDAVIAAYEKTLKLKEGK